MKIKHILFYSIIFLILIAIGLITIFEFNTSLSIKNIVSLNTKNTTLEELSQIESCNQRESINGLDRAIDGHLKKLYQYQEVCNSFVTDELMIFIDMPKDDVIATERALKLSEILKEFSNFNIKPIIIVEPVTDWGLIDFEEFDNGFYDNWIKTFFTVLKSTGIISEMTGLWVPFPEANLPYWNRSNATPEQFGLVVNRYLRLLKEIFPNARGSILLNSATYESTDFNWENGEYISLSSYVSLIDKSLIESFGIQGFPWRNSAQEKKEITIYNAFEFINPPIAIEAAKILGVKKVWINTGTFSSKYTLEPSSTVFIQPITRKEILNDILKQAILIKKEGFEVSINLFAQDKSNTEESTNWSYFSSHLSKDPNIFILKEFIQNLNKNSIKLTLFDL